MSHEVTNQIIRRFQNDPPVDVSAVAEALGLRVWESDDLPEGISGMLMKDDVNGGTEHFSITVRESDAYVRKRFTVAHEIAHFVLHRHKIGSGLRDDAMYRSGLSTREEAQANRYAADLLMPRHLIQKYVRIHGLNSSALAELFEVSEAAMRIRLGQPAPAAHTATL